MRKQVLVTADRGQTRVAILEAEGEPSAASGNGASSRAQRGRRGSSGGAIPRGWRVGELYIERRSSRSIVGNIYKGRVDNVLPGLEAAFVDIGIDKNGFLHVDDIVMPGVEVQPLQTRGIDTDNKEAVAFAVLAVQSLHGEVANLPSVTGARSGAVLGKLCLPPVG